MNLAESGYGLSKASEMRRINFESNAIEIGSHLRIVTIVWGNDKVDGYGDENSGTEIWGMLKTCKFEEGCATVRVWF